MFVKPCTVSVDRGKKLYKDFVLCVCVCVYIYIYSVKVKFVLRYS